jgi:hypothetical protein
VIDEQDDYRWELGASGTGLFGPLSMQNGGPLPAGRYSYALFIEGRQATSGSFSIGQGSGPGPGPGPETEGVALTGKIVDADTGRPIPGAEIHVFVPGTTFDDVIDATTDEAFEELLAAWGVADATGTFTTDPLLPRGQRYPVGVVANGYSAFFAESGLAIAANAPDVIQLEPIKLKKR